MRRIYLSILVVLVLGVGMRATAAPVKVLAFHLNGIGAFTSGGGKSLSFQGAWTPGLDLGIIGLRGELGATFFKNVLNNTFFVTNYEVFGVFSLAPALAFEVGGGMQTWHGNGGTASCLGGNLVLFVPLSWLELLFVGYERVFFTGGVNILRAGIGIAL